MEGGSSSLFSLSSWDALVTKSPAPFLFAIIIFTAAFHLLILPQNLGASHDQLIGHLNDAMKNP